MSRAPTEPLPTGSGGAPENSGGAPADSDAGFRLILPTDPCVTYSPPDCPPASTQIFGCPILYGPNRSADVHPGDAITVIVPMSDDGLASYSCAGVGTDSRLTGGAALFYAVRPAYVQDTGQIPPSTPPGTVMHFTASASGNRYVSSPSSTGCSDDLTQLDFNVLVE